MRFLDQIKNTAEVGKRRIELVAANYFFTCTVELPDEAVGEGIRDFAELSLEGLSPFPLDQLSWGFIVSHEEGKLFLYAACKPRMPSSVTEEWERALFVFPSFYPFLRDCRKQVVVRAVVSNNTLSALVYAPHSCFPQRIVHHQLEENADDKNWSDMYAELKKKLHVPAEVEDDGIYQMDAVSADSHRCVSFEVSHQGGSGPCFYSNPILCEGAGELWQSDIREHSFKQSAIKRRNLEKQLSLGVAASIGLAAVFLLINILTWVGMFWNAQRERIVVEQDPGVMAIQQNQDFLDALHQFSGNPFMPFEILSFLSENRPSGLYFKSASIAADDRVSIQGFSRSVDQVNEFSKKLQDSGLFSNVELVDIKTPRGTVNFTLNLSYLN